MGLQRYNLGPDALAYVRSELEHARSSLAGAALLHLPLEAGRLSAYLPPGIRTEDLYDFQSGGVGGPVNDLVVDRVSSHLSAGPDRVGLFEKRGVRRGDLTRPDLAWACKGLPFLTLDDEVVMIAQGGVPTDVVRTIVREAHWYPAVGVLSSLAVEEIPSPASAMSAETLDRLVDRVTQLFIGAYDGEEWLIWESSTRPANGH